VSRELQEAIPEVPSVAVQSTETGARYQPAASGERLGVATVLGATVS
jgi:hypothetical protein